MILAFRDIKISDQGHLQPDWWRDRNGHPISMQEYTLIQTLLTDTYGGIPIIAYFKKKNS